MRVVKTDAEWCSDCVIMKPQWAKVEKAQPWLKTEYLDFDQGKEKLSVFIFLDKKGKEFLRLRCEPSIKKASRNNPREQK